MTIFAGVSARNPLMLVGCGHMGLALLQAWQKRGIHRTAVIIVDPVLNNLAVKKKYKIFQNIKSAFQKYTKPRVIVIAVKPQDMSLVLKELKSVKESKVLILSIAAGFHISAIRNILGKHSRIIRAMPNSPIAYQSGVTVMTISHNATFGDKCLAVSLFRAGGKVIFTKNEQILDIATAVSGSGPAYFLLMVEALAAAARKVGLNKKIAEILSYETMLGTADLMKATQLTPNCLRKRVTSKGGTTEAALKMLNANGGLKTLLNRAVRAAIVRSRQLSG